MQLEYIEMSLYEGGKEFFLLVLYIDYQHTFFSKRKYIKNNALKSVLLCIWRDCAVAICHRWWADDFITPSTNHVAFKKDVIRLDHRASLSKYFLYWIKIRGVKGIGGYYYNMINRLEIYLVFLHFSWKNYETVIIFTNFTKIIVILCM